MLSHVPRGRAGALAIPALAVLLAGIPVVAAPEAIVSLTATRIDRVRDASPGPFGALGDRVLFAATTPAEGRELWITDGTEAGTRLVVDLLPGRDGSDPRDFVGVAGRLFFVANDSTGFGRVFETDGTGEGTRRSPLFPSSGSFWILPADTWPGWIVAIGADGDGLWRTDGLSAATRIGPGSGWNRFHRTVHAGGALYLDWWSIGFSRIHRFDADGTYSVVAEAGAGAGLVGAVGDAVVFVTQADDTAAPVLWTQPRAGPPVRIRAADLPRFGVGAGATTNGGVLVFETWAAGAPALWRTDGTAEGTRRVAAVGDPGSSFASDPVAAGARVFFLLRDGRGSKMLWASDGTTAGTGRVDLPPGVEPCGTPVPVGAGVAVPAAAAGGCLPEAPGALWSSDGTAAETRELARFERIPWQLARVGPEVWFAGSDAAGEEPWRTDGTVEGTHRIADVSAEPGGAEPSGVVALHGAVLFAAEDAAHGRELWRADASRAGLLADLRAGGSGSSPTRLVRARDRVFLYDDAGSVSGPYGPVPVARLLRTDGTGEGTAVLRTGIPFPTCTGTRGASRACVDGPVAVEDRVHFVVPDLADLDGRHFVADEHGASARELGRGDRVVWWPTASGENLWFVGRAGLVRATRDGLTTSPAPPGGATELTAAGNRLFLGGSVADDPFAPHGLWVREEGGALHAVREFDGLDFEVAPYGVRALTWIEPRLYFAAATLAEGLEPWTSDGTAAGTTSLGDLAPGPEGSRPEGFVGVRGAVFFWADDGSHGREPWVTDGTPAGTRLVADLWPGPASSRAGDAEFVPLGPAGPVVFAASDGSHGDELWVSDGTASGTRRVTDLAPGVRSSSPDALAVTADHLFFAADDAVRGGQLYAVVLDELAPGAERFRDPPAEPRPRSGGCASGDGGALAVVVVLLALVERGRRSRSRRGAGGTWAVHLPAMRGEAHAQSPRLRALVAALAASFVACADPAESGPPQRSIDSTPDACEPLFTSCEQVGRNCGLWQDGCGRWLDCGTCAAKESCEAGGERGVCAVPPPELSRPRWLRRLATAGTDRVAPAISTVGGGDVVILWYSAAESLLRLDRIGPDRLSSVRAFPVTGGEPDVSVLPAPDGTLFVRLGSRRPASATATVDLGDGPREAPYLAQLRADGGFVRDLCAPEGCDVRVLAADAAGDLVVDEAHGGGSTVALFRGDGTRVTLVARRAGTTSGVLSGMTCKSAAFDTGNHVVCGGDAPGPVEYLGGYTGSNPALARVDLTGRLLWKRTVPGVDGSVDALTVTAGGTIVAGGSYVGFGRFGDGWLDQRQMAAWSPAGFLVSLDCDGAPRWARGAIGPVLSLAAGPDGRVAAVTGGDLGPSRIVVLGPDGASLLDWHAGAPDAYPASVALTSAELFVAASWSGDHATFGASVASSWDVAVAAFVY